MSKTAWVWAFLALMLASGMVHAQAAIGKPGDLTAGANLGGTEVYFGSYADANDSSVASNGPVLWYVVDTGADTATLWTTTSMGSRQYNTSPAHLLWSGSDLAHWLNGTGTTHNGNGFLQNAFSVEEREAIVAEYGTINEPFGEGVSWAGTIDSRQKIALPSVAELGNGSETGTWNIDRATRAFGHDWWLRSPADALFHVAVTTGNGNVASGGATFSGAMASESLVVRPAFKLDLASVVFTSSAVGGKTGSVGPNLSEVQPTTGEVKLTVKDVGLTLSVADTSPRTVQSNGTVNVDYTNATTGANHYVSCVIENNAGEVLFYGKLVDASGGAATGTARFVIPSAVALPEGDYTIKLFVEEINGDHLTDFASDLIEILLTVVNDSTNGATVSIPALNPVGLVLLALMLAGMAFRRREKLF